jgi:PPP family 3-phenylpropionic acid transporter
MSLRALTGPAGRMTSAFYAGIFLALGAHLPFWPIWLADWGLTQPQVGALLGAAILVRVSAGVGGPWLADFTGRRRTALALMGAVGIAAFALHPLAPGYGTLAALTFISAAALAGAMPIGDALASAAARMHGFAYAQVRAVGSAAFLFANIACGWAVAVWGSGAALWWIVASLCLMTVAAMRHPGGVRPPGGLAAERPRLAEAAALLRRRPFLLAASAFALAQGAHGPLYAYGSLLWREQGLSEGAIGGLWAWGVAVEVALMLLIGGWLVRRCGAWGAYALAGGAAAVRFAAMALGPSEPWLWFWQATHALSFAAAHLAMVAFVSAAAPDRLSASAQGLIGPGAGGIVLAAGTFGAAALLPAAGQGVYWIGAALGLGALAAALGLRRSWDGGRIV